ncbi:hypothetical protein ACE1TI_00180 [Alteribacillus sp. JSM 102045]|uniref:hypothetical protein n=1 Tax=Alteribacillus sp. JSM 102045 TaxID=1562101 RepID=UPI0035C140DD
MLVLWWFTRKEYGTKQSALIWGRKIINQHIQKNEPLHPLITYRYQYTSFEPGNISSVGISKSTKQ